MKLFKKFKIDFIVIGAQKAGTSALDNYLNNHPDIGMGNKKELHFFDTDSYFKNSKVNYSIYHKGFTLNKENKIYGETTPIYMFWKPSIKRIKKYNKNIKLIAILRNPIERAYSQWNMEFKRNFETKDFNFCIKRDIELFKSDNEIQDRVSSYVQRGFYSHQIKNILDNFNKDQVIFIKYEEFLEKQKETVKNVFKFLAVENENHLISLKKAHNIKYLKSINNNDKEYLHDVYEKDIIKVEELLDWDCSDWKK